MNKEYFYFNDWNKVINNSFVKDGWITIYLSENNGFDDQIFIFCCLVNNDNINLYMKDNDWKIHPGYEGKASVVETSENGKRMFKYETYSEEGIEPFIFTKHFNFIDGSDSYIDVSEEFVLYFKLFEKGNKNDRIYYFIDDSGELEEVIKLTHKKVIVKLKYLNEYLFIRKMSLSICFDLMRLIKIEELSFKIEIKDKIYKNSLYNYNHYVRDVNLITDVKAQSWIHGKIIIPAPNDCILHFDYGNKRYETFITGYDDQGNEILMTCNDETHKSLLLTYFKREVLNKYYNEPTRYAVDAFGVQSKFFNLRIDNNLEECVAVFLGDLSSLPYKEQLHWKQYNLPPQNIISKTYYDTMIEGKWSEHPETPDLFFKYKYNQFNNMWKKEYGWSFYKPLSKEDEYIFTSLHIPNSNNVKSFCEQVLSIVKLTIDRINEKEFERFIKKDLNDRGITKLEKFLIVHNVILPDMIEFLRKLWDLRSGLLSHSFSSSNKKCRDAMIYFGFENKSYKEISKDIFIKSIWTLNSLEKQLLLGKVEI